MAISRDYGLGKIMFVGSSNGGASKWTENLAYTPINFGNPNATQDAYIDGQQVTNIDTAQAAQNLFTFCQNLANLTTGTFEDLTVRYDVRFYNVP